MRFPFGLLLVGALACSSGTSALPDANNTITLRIEPATATLHVINRAPATQAFQVFAKDAAGVETDVTASATLSTPTSVGTITGANLEVTGATVGHATLTAAYQGAMSTAALLITSEDTRVDASAPPGIDALFDAATTPAAHTLSITYPPNQVAVPKSLGDLDVHWSASPDTAYEIRLTNQYASLRVFMGPTSPANFMRFLPEEWTRTINAEPRVEVRVRGIDVANPTVIATSEPVVVLASTEDMQGGIYYWSTGNNGAIWRHDMAKAGEPAEEYLTAAEAGQCVGCHALSRDGARMVVTTIDGSAGLYDVAAKTKVADFPGTGAFDLFAYHPSGDVVLAQSGTSMRVLDGHTGALITTQALTENIVMPDFSPSGDRLVYIGGETSGSHHVVSGTGGIFTRTFDATTNTLGEPTPVLQTGDYVFYPVVSPDGQWIAFTRAPSGNSVNNISAELWVVRIDGTSPIKLATASIGAGLANSWVRWAPFAQQVNGHEVYWLTFSSQRPYGAFGATAPQLWMASFAPGLAAAGQDPTTPAFRLPFQDRTVGNHIGQWTETVVPIE